MNLSSDQREHSRAPASIKRQRGVSDACWILRWPGGQHRASIVAPIREAKPRRFESKTRMAPSLLYNGILSGLLPRPNGGTMARDFTDLHVKLIGGPAPSPYRWEIYRGHDPVWVERAMHGYRTKDRLCRMVGWLLSAS